ncbi:hypothetical protein [Lactiplantibacillus plantarum]|uniref:hypothetical protein n=1 Tax=Lactiplantibacillus plantarum TaxID=1590 RepID=UPI000E46C83E|nr:hypothetical protein [Lactiplantibacillus plantarum]QDJ17478.1 hypothetical protein CL175_10290 [Lactiplantibacillus plantarum]RHF45743.1 hypothetical protein DW678_07085 [Lactiplantibacillus plantarum]
MCKENSEKEFNDNQTKLNNMLETITLGFIQFLPKDGISNAKDGEFWLQNTDKLIGTKVNDYDHAEIEKILSRKPNTCAYSSLREDPLEGRLLREHIKESTNFMSCFTKITINDIDRQTFNLNDRFIENAKIAGMNTNDKGFVFIPDMKEFYNTLNDSLQKMPLIQNRRHSDLYFREVRYLNSEHYKEEASKLERELGNKNIHLDAGLTIDQANQDNVLNEYFKSLKFAVTTKLLTYSIQGEARLAINFTDSIKQDFIKINCNSFSNTMNIFDNFSCLERLSFKNQI